MIKVLIVDDMIILRECLRLAISQENEFQVVGCAANGKEAVEMNRKLNPDIILMDLNMPVYSGHEAILRIRKDYKACKILVLTVEGDEKNVTEAFKNGADGYVLKDIAPDELFQVMKKAYLEEKYIADNSFCVSKDNYVVDKTFCTQDIPYKIELTERERSVLELVMEGMTNEEIADHIGVSVGRARNIVGDLISKFMVKNRTQLAVIAVKLCMAENEEGILKIYE